MIHADHWLFLARTFLLLLCGGVLGNARLPPVYKLATALVGGAASGLILRALQ